MAASRIGVRRVFEAVERSSYFDPSLRLLNDDYPFEVIIAFMFMRLEQAQRDTLVWGAMKRHKLEKDLTRKAVDDLDITRGNYPTFFKTVYGRPLGAGMSAKLSHAESVRDDLMHGRKPSERAKRQAICEILEFFMNSRIGFTILRA